MVLLNSREPIALHWPVIEFAPVPGRPMLPVISARLMIACAVRVASWPWFTPIVHQNETRLPAWIVSAKLFELPSARRNAGAPPQTTLGRESRCHELVELLEPARVLVDELAVDPAARDQQCARCRRATPDRSSAACA